MSAVRLGDLTPYPDINALLTEWVQGLKRRLGDGIVGLYLGGSLSYGDFVPDRSDIDLEDVVRFPMT
jgi:predicted nucleotidyltransferase